MRYSVSKLEGEALRAEGHYNHGYSYIHGYILYFCLSR